MKPGLCYPSVRLGLLGAAVLIALATGCSNSSSYPAKLRYGVRKDLLVTEKSKIDQRQLPPPGQIDESIARAPEVKTIDPTKALSKEQRDELRDALEDVFGTPAKPRVAVIGGPEGMPADTAAYAARGTRAFLTDDGKKSSVGLAEIDELELDEESLRRGSGLYRRHCMHCHGVSGDGRGPTAPWLHPHPRDYRAGLFKFISTNYALDTRKPRRADLLRIIGKGIDGTSMPAFGLLPERQVAQLASYVTHLAIRGEVEIETIKAISNKDELDGGSITTHVRAKAADLLVQWASSSASAPSKPPAYPEKFQKEGSPRDFKEQVMQESIARGYKLFVDSSKGGCAACHTDFGRQAPYKYDDWGTLVRPRNLTEGQYRGGRRPVDFFWRVSGGIGPSGMTAVPDALRKNEEIWDLIHFVQALPYPAMLPDEVRLKVYGGSAKKGSTTVTRATHP